MADRIVSSESIKAIDVFSNHVNEATVSMYSRWQSEGYSLSPEQMAIYVLFFRNSVVWDSMFSLLLCNKLHGAIFLFRMLLDGVITFDWCCLDVKNRAFRFRLTSFLSTLEYLELSKSDDERKKTLADAVESLKSKGITKLPPKESMIDELKIVEKNVLRRWYKYFSKTIHGEFEEWFAYELLPIQMNLKVHPTYLFDVYHLKSISAFLQMRNIVVMSNLFAPLAYDNTSVLETEWAIVYANCIEDEKLFKTN